MFLWGCEFKVFPFKPNPSSIFIYAELPWGTRISMKTSFSVQRD